jgi:hypothetical protein
MPTMIIPGFENLYLCINYIGTSMASNGVPVHDVAQVFGHTNDESVKPYIATDMEHLKMCSLPFDGIAPKGGGTV